MLRLKNLICISMILSVLLFRTLVFADDITNIHYFIDNENKIGFSYVVNSDGKTASIHHIGGIGELDDNSVEYDNFYIPEELPDDKDESIKYRVTAIGDGINHVVHFINNDTPEADHISSVSLNIPDSITDIKDKAFCDCGKDAFISIKLSKNLINIGNEAFSGCSSISGNLVFPEGLKAIGGHAFKNCSGLSGNIVIPNGVIKIGNLNAKEIDVPDQDKKAIVYDNYGSFEGCEGIESIEIPSSIEEFTVPLETVDYWPLIDGCYNLKRIINRSKWDIGNLPGDERSGPLWKNAKSGEQSISHFEGDWGVLYPMRTANRVLIREDYAGKLGVDLNDPDFNGNRYFIIKDNNDTYIIRWNDYVYYSGKKHTTICVGSDGSLSKPSTKNKTSDVVVTVTKNGEILDPSLYSVKIKGKAKNSCWTVTDVSEEGVYTWGIDGEKDYSPKDRGWNIPFCTFRIRIKNTKILTEGYFHILPVRINTNGLKAENPKLIGDRVKFRKVSFRINDEDKEPLILKYSKKDSKTSYVATISENGSYLISGKNNYCGDAFVTN